MLTVIIYLAEIDMLNSHNLGKIAHQPFGEACDSHGDDVVSRENEES